MKVFVFPLGRVVFQPNTSKPLNIFEPRYIQMVHDALKTGTPIALGHVDEPDQEYKYEYGEPLRFVRSIAGFGFPLILEERKDKTMLIFLQGKGKVRLGKVLNEGTPYIVCEADVISENADVMPHSSGQYFVVHKILMNWIKTNVPDPNNREQLIRNIRTPEEVVGCVASYMIADHDLQQLILESNDINEKIHLITGLISSGEAV